jgi:aldehyde:ferredoxin oxidoreductase
MEVPMHDPRAFFSMAVNYATGARGADHMRGNAMAYETGLMPAEDEALRQAEGSAGRRKRFDDQGKGRAAKLAQDRAAVINSMIICMFAGQDMPIRELADTLSMVIGFHYTGEEVLRIGERIVNLQRAFNLRCGLSEQEDRLPPRLLEPTDEGGHAGRVPDLSLQLREYYEARGWTAEGRPRPEKLRELGLEEVARDLSGLNPS